MFFELVATIVFGVGAAGIAMLLRRLSGGGLPRFTVPAAAGLAMLGFTIWSEYAWFERQTGALPSGVVVASTISEPGFWRPWTYAVPMVTRFIAVDRAQALRHDQVPTQVLVDVYLFARHTPTASFPVLLDCAGARRADVVDGVTLRADGGVDNAVWRDVGVADPLITTVCDKK